jgi:hypothetical protein
MKRDLRSQLIWLIPLLVLTLGIAGYYGVRLYEELTASVVVEVMPAPAAEPGDLANPPAEEETTFVARRLREAGLNETPVLGDTAITGHLARLENGEVSEETLLQYADNLIYLNAYTTANGGSIPTSFWDVRTPEMTENGWDEYSVVQQSVVPEAEPYLLLLAKGYGRFLQFKAAETSGDDTALDAALDMFAFVEDYWTTLNPESIDESSAEEVEGIANGKLLVWQSLVAGSTRINPLIGEPMFSHSIFARDNVDTMYQYDLGEAMSIADIWGVTGFAPQFVGIPENNNQVEHMSISMLLQLVMAEPVAVLDAIEEEKVVTGQADAAEANADMALNSAIHNEFAPSFAENGLQAVEQLRCFLKGMEQTSDCSLNRRQNSN